MAILNRTKDISEQRVVLPFANAATATGVTLTVGVVPWPAVIDCAQMAAWGLSSAPSYELALNRFIVGTGFTTIVLAKGTSNVVAEYGTSGPGAIGGLSAMICVSSGSTLAQLLPNDVLTITSGVANSAAKGVAFSIAIRPIQDAKVHFGVV
jgi:hypothetical protein